MAGFTADRRTQVSPPGTAAGRHAIAAYSAAVRPGTIAAVRHYEGYADAVPASGDPTRRTVEPVVARCTGYGIGVPITSVMVSPLSTVHPTEGQMNGRMWRRIGVLLAGLVVCPMARAADSTAVQVGQRAPSLTLKDRQGKAFSLDTPRTLPLVLVFSGQASRDQAREWGRSIRSLLGEGAQFTAYTVGRPREGAGPRGGEGRQGPPGRPPQGEEGGPPPSGGPQADRGGRAQVLVDSTGAVTQRWIGASTTQPVVVVISPDNVVRAVITGPASHANIQQVRQRVAALRPSGK